MFGSVFGPKTPESTRSSVVAASSSIEAAASSVDLLGGRPITDLVVTLGAEPGPEGYVRVAEHDSLDGGVGTLGKAPRKSGREAVLWAKTTDPRVVRRAAELEVVVGLAVVRLSRGEVALPGFFPVPLMSDRGAAADLGGDGDRVHLCARKASAGAEQEAECSPVTDLVLVRPGCGAFGLQVVSLTPRGHSAALCLGPGPCFLAYRQTPALLRSLSAAPALDAGPGTGGSDTGTTSETALDAAAREAGERAALLKAAAEEAKIEAARLAAEAGALAGTGTAGGAAPAARDDLPLRLRLSSTLGAKVVDQAVGTYAIAWGETGAPYVQRLRTQPASYSIGL